MAQSKPTSSFRGKKPDEVTCGIAHIKATDNNTCVTITDLSGKVLVSKTGGSVGFKGAKKNTPFAAQLAASKAAEIANVNFEMKKIAIYVKGVGPGRDAAPRALVTSGLQVLFIKDKTGVPHGGCRAPKTRRV